MYIRIHVCIYISLSLSLSLSLLLWPTLDTFLPLSLLPSSLSYWLQSLLEKERDQSNVHVAELEAIQVSLEKQVATYQGQLTAEQTKSKALDTSKREVRSAGNLYSVQQSQNLGESHPVSSQILPANLWNLQNRATKMPCLEHRQEVLSRTVFGSLW